MKNLIKSLFCILILISVTGCSSQSDNETIVYNFNPTKISVNSNESLFNVEFMKKKEPTQNSDGSPMWGIRLYNKSGYIYFVVSNSIKQQTLNFSSVDEIKNIRINDINGKYYLDNSYGDNNVLIQVIFDNDLSQITDKYSYGIISEFDQDYYSDNEEIINELINSFKIIE
jgi:hypothetical protein